MLEEAIKVFHEAEKKYKIKLVPYHYQALIIGLADNGKLDEAERLLYKIPSHKGTQYGLLDACRKHGDRVRAERIIKAEQISFSDEKMELLRGKTKPARSYLELNGKTHVISTGEIPMNVDATKALLTKWDEELKIVGYKPETSKDWIEGYEKVEERTNFGTHSEKIALALAVLQKEKSMFIVKTTAICRNCHTELSAISKIENIKIVVRDAQFFHTFENGQCSCRRDIS